MRFQFQTKLVLFILLISTLPIFGQNSKAIDLTQLDAIVSNKKFVNIGEDSHFMVEVHKFIAAELF